MSRKFKILDAPLMVQTMGNDMKIYNGNMPEAAWRAQELAQQRLAVGTETCTSRKQADKRGYRLTAAYRGWRADEREYTAQRTSGRRADIRALDAKTFVHTRRTPKLTACRAKLAQMKETTNKARIARARSPERVRAAMVRHMNTLTHKILKQRGLK